MYRSMISSLHYVIALRPYVMQEVGQVARFQEAAKEIHDLAVKRIFRYLQGTTDFGLWYPNENELAIVSYIDTDWEGCVDDRRSISSEDFYLGDCLVSWLRNKCSLVSLSTT